MQAIFEQFQQNRLSAFLYGATWRTLEMLKRNLQSKFPACRIVGAHAPPFRPAGAHEDNAVIEEINVSAADIIWVGLARPNRNCGWLATGIVCQRRL